MPTTDSPKTCRFLATTGRKKDRTPELVLCFSLHDLLSDAAVTATMGKSEFAASLDRMQAEIDKWREENPPESRDAPGDPATAPKTGTRRKKTDAPQSAEVIAALKALEPLEMPDTYDAAEIQAWRNRSLTLEEVTAAVPHLGGIEDGEPLEPIRYGRTCVRCQFKNPDFKEGAIFEMPAGTTLFALKRQEKRGDVQLTVVFAEGDFKGRIGFLDTSEVALDPARLPQPASQPAAGRP